MDEVSTVEELGKSVGKDKASGKLTYVSLYGLESAKTKFHKLMEECYGIMEKYNSIHSKSNQKCKTPKSNNMN